MLPAVRRWARGSPPRSASCGGAPSPVWRAHGYRELLPSALDPAGQAAGSAGSPLPGPDGSELRSDAMAALARVYAAGPDHGRFARCMMAGTVFDREAVGQLRAASYEVASGVIFGTPRRRRRRRGRRAGAGARRRSWAGAAPSWWCRRSASRPISARYLRRARRAASRSCAIGARRRADPLRFFSCDEEGCRALAAAAPFAARVRVDAGAQASRGLLATLEVAGDPGA